MAAPEEVLHAPGVAGLREQFARTSTPDLRLRTRDEVAALLDGATLLEPGVVPTAAWRPDQPINEQHANRSNAYAAVGLLPPHGR